MVRTSPVGRESPKDMQVKNVDCDGVQSLRGRVGRQTWQTLELMNASVSADIERKKWRRRGRIRQCHRPAFPCNFKTLLKKSWKI